MVPIISNCLAAFFECEPFAKKAKGTNETISSTQVIKIILFRSLLRYRI